ncbi:hypothetical protein EON82_15485 [bacterium]|nr:MAG: hypothetical protein EON82_15485 [bacterium]
MIRNANVFLLATALMASVPVLARALTPQEPPVQGQQVPVGAERLAKTPAQVLFRCKVIRTDEPGRKAFSTSKKEPVVSKDRPPKVISAPIVRSIVGLDATISTSHNGDETSVKLRAEVEKNGDYKVTVEPSFTIANTARSSKIVSAVVRPNGWLRCRFQDADGKYLGLQLLVQVMPVTDTP